MIPHNRSALRLVNTNEIRPSPYNPPNRTADVEDLKKSMSENTQLDAIHVVQYGEKLFKPGDGHRRVEAAKLLNLKEMRAIVYKPIVAAESDEDFAALYEAACDQLVEDLFSELNGNKMTFKNAAMLQAYLRGGPCFNATVRAAGNYIHSLWPEQVPQIVLDSASPTMVAVVKKAVKYIKPGLGSNANAPAFKSVARQVMPWMIRNLMQQKCIAFMRLGRSNTVLEKVIEENKSELPRLTEEDMKRANVRNTGV